MEAQATKAGEVVVADIIGPGIYRIHSTGPTFVNVELLKLFGKGWKWRGHITNCHNYPHPVDWSRWNALKRLTPRSWTFIHNPTK